MRVDELNDTNCKTYLVASGSQALLVDPVRERVLTYLAVLRERGLELVAIVETHTHADHLMIDRKAKQALGVPVVMHQNSPSPLVDRHVDDGDVIAVGDEKLTVWHSPGHTPDSCCFVFDGGVLTGDTLLIGGSGRTDFPGGDAGAQWDAVVNRLFGLPDATVVYPAHDYKGRKTSTIAAEKQENQRFFGRTRADYQKLMAELALPLPDKIQQALQVNQSGFEPDEVSFPSVVSVAKIRELAPPELQRELAGASPPLVLDVREPEEFVGELGHIEGALLVPLDLLQLRLPKLHGYADRRVVLVCRAGARSASAAAILERAGFSHVENLQGGMLAWNAAGLSVQR